MAPPVVRIWACQPGTTHCDCVEAIARGRELLERDAACVQTRAMFGWPADTAGFTLQPATRYNVRKAYADQHVRLCVQRSLAATPASVSTRVRAGVSLTQKHAQISTATPFYCTCASGKIPPLSAPPSYTPTISGGIGIGGATSARFPKLYSC